MRHNSWAVTQNWLIGSSSLGAFGEIQCDYCSLVAHNSQIFCMLDMIVPSSNLWSVRLSTLHILMQD